MNKIKKPISKKILSIIGLVLAGIVGTALWDLVFRDLTYNLGDYFVKTFSYFHTGYLDSVYKKVGNMYFELPETASGILVFMLIFSPMIIMMIFSVVIDEKNRKNGIEEYNFFQKFIEKFITTDTRILIFGFVIGLPLSLSMSDYVIKEYSNHSAFKYVDRGIEIIRPNIENNEFIKLRSEFRLVDNRQKLNDLIDKIHIISYKNNIELPECKLYGIDVIEKQ